jgi:aldose 1-epimerase
VLVPWPNRIPDGVWKLDGVAQQLDLTEPDKHNAIHGLLRHAPYSVIERSDGAVTLGATVFPQHGYPFLLETSVRHELTDDGMTVTHRITNESAQPAPVAIGTHPFFQIGDVPTDELTLTVHAGTRFPVDERLNVSAEIAVDGEYDLRDGRRVAEVNLDDAFGDVKPDNQVTAVLTAPDGRSVALWQDENFPYVQIFTTRKFPRGTGFVTAIAMEPMTAPANAFNTGQSLKWLNPGETWQAAWGIRYMPAA